MREIGGDWLANTIIHSAEWGIRLDATATNIFNEIDPTLTALSMSISGSLIDSNGFDGIEFNGPGRLLIDSNQITNNGVNLAVAATFGNGADDDDGSGTLVRIDATSGAFIDTTPVGEAPRGPVFSNDLAWIFNAADGTLVGHDLGSAEAVETVNLTERRRPYGASAGLELDVDLITGLAIPVVVGLVGFGVWRLRRLVERDARSDGN